MLNKGYKIEYTNYMTEFEVQCKLYHKLKKKKIDVRGEVIGSYRGNKKTASFDLVVFKDKKAICIIEVKRDRGRKRGKIMRRNLWSSVVKQLTRYDEFGIPVLLCVGYKDISEVVADVRSLLYCHNKYGEGYER